MVPIIFSQNTFKYSFAIGSNLTNLCLEKESEDNKYGTFSYRTKLGFESLIGVSFKISNKTKINNYVHFSIKNYNINFNRYVYESENLIDSTTWKVKSETNFNTFGILFGLEHQFRKKISLGVSVELRKQFNEKTANFIHSNISFLSLDFEETKYSDSFYDLLGSFEINYLLTRYLKIRSSISYSFAMQNFFPTEKYSDKYEFFGHIYSFQLILLYEIN